MTLVMTLSESNLSTRVCIDSAELGFNCHSLVQYPNELMILQFRKNLIVFLHLDCGMKVP